jgi:hypothetical protein
MRSSYAILPIQSKIHYHSFLDQFRTANKSDSFGESTWETYRDPDGPKGTPNPFSSLRESVPRPLVSLPSTEVYQLSPQGPLRIVNNDSPSDSPSDAQTLPGFVKPPGFTVSCKILKVSTLLINFDLTKI